MRRIALALVLALGCSKSNEKPEPPAPAAADSKVPAVGAVAPNGTGYTAKNAKVELASLWPQHAKTVLVFYRGFY